MYASIHTISNVLLLFQTSSILSHHNTFQSQNDSGHLIHVECVSNTDQNAAGIGGKADQWRGSVHLRALVKTLLLGSYIKSGRTKYINTRLETF